MTIADDLAAAIRTETDYDRRTALERIQHYRAQRWLAGDSAASLAQVDAAIVIMLEQSPLYFRVRRLAAEAAGRFMLPQGMSGGELVREIIDPDASQLLTCLLHAWEQARRYATAADPYHDRPTSRAGRELLSILMSLPLPAAGAHYVIPWAHEPHIADRPLAERRKGLSKQ